LPDPPAFAVKKGAAMSTIMMRAAAVLFGMAAYITVGLTLASVG